MGLPKHNTGLFASSINYYLKDRILYFVQYLIAFRNLVNYYVFKLLYIKTADNIIYNYLRNII